MNFVGEIEIRKKKINVDSIAWKIHKMVKIDNPIKENVVSKNCFCMLRFTLVYISRVQYLMNETLLKYKNASLVLLRSRKYSKKPLCNEWEFSIFEILFCSFHICTPCWTTTYVRNKTYQSSVIFYPGFGSLAVVEGYMYMLLIIEYSAIYNAGTS